MEHGGADDKHSGEQDDGGVCQTGKNCLRRNKAQKPAGYRSAHGGYRKRYQFSDEKYGDDS